MNQNQENNQQEVLVEDQNQLKRDYFQLLDDILEIVENQLFILDSIHRRTSYNQLLGTIWRHQINSLSEYQRYLLYDKLKQLKSLLHLWKQFCGVSLYMVIEKQGIWKFIKVLLQRIQQDVENIDAFIDGSLWEDLKRLQFGEETQILKNVQMFIRLENRPVDKDVMDFVLKLMNLDQWNRFKVISCNLCSLKNVKPQDFFEHLLEHLDFFQLYDAQLGRCMDIKCFSKRDHKKTEFNLRKHTLEHHSTCYTLERPIRYCFTNSNDEYGNSWKQYQYFKNDITRVLSIINPTYCEQFEREYQRCGLKGANKEMHFKLNIREALVGMTDEWNIQNLELLDIVTVYLTTTWKKLFTDPNTILDDGIPHLLKQLFASVKVPCYNQQVRLIDVIVVGTQLNSLKMKLFLGYFNSTYTQKELEHLIKDFTEGLQGIAIFNAVLNGKFKRVAPHCIFNEILCEKRFESREDALKHYFNQHTGIMICVADENCQWNQNYRIDEWFEHCHDRHKEDFVTLISKYLKEQKKYFQFKAVCFRCKIKLQSLKDVYWTKSNNELLQKWGFNINVQWKDICRSYNNQREIGDGYMQQFMNSFEEYKLIVLEQMDSKRTYNNIGQIAACKDCKKNKQLKMAHLKQEQFINRESNRILPLVKLEGRITRKGSDTFFRVMGNLNALKEKPHIFFAGTDIMYSWNQTQAKKQFRCRLMDKSQLERTDYVKACQNHGFLMNHTYQLVDLTQQLLRQEQQILYINKNLWLRYLEKENISNAKDKLQLEFAKLQDMLLFDGLLHRTQVIFVCQKMKLPIQDFNRDFKEFMRGEKAQKHNLKDRCLELFEDFRRINGEDRLFWEITMINYLICEQKDARKMEFTQDEQLDSLPELLLLNRDWNIFADWFRINTLIEVREFIDNAIHPIYLGVYYQQLYQKFDGKRDLNNNQRRIIEIVLQTYALLIIDTCLLNHGLTMPDQNNTFYQAEKDQLLRCEQFLLYEMMDMLDDQQFIDMQGRIALVEKAIEDGVNGNRIDEIMPSDLRWTVQIATLFLSSLKAQVHYFHPGQDRELRKQHLNLMKGLEEEIEYFYSRNDAVYKQDFLTTTYREVIQEIVDNEIFPLTQQGTRQMKNYTNAEINRLSKYEYLRRLNFVFWIPVEQKLKNLLNVHKVLRELVDKEPYFQMTQQYNVTSFYKELEYSMFPRLYPNSQGGLVTKCPEPKEFQLVVDLIQQEKLMAPTHLQQLGQLRQTQIQRQIDRNQILNSNNLDVDIQLVDFNVKEQFGNVSYQPTKAIYKFLKQPIINSNQSLAHLLEIQQLAPLQYEQQRVQLEDSHNEEWRLPQIINVEIKVNNQIGAQSIIENHVAQNLDKYIRNQKQQWDNELEEFTKNQKNAVQNLQETGATREEVQGFIMMQKKILIDTKIKQLSQDHAINQVFDRIRRRNILRLDDSVATSESEEEERNQQRRKQEKKILEQVDDFYKNVIDSLQGNQIQSQNSQQQQQVIQQKDILELIDLDKEKVNLSEDTKFRLKCSFTENFAKDYRWILWRYYEWIKSQFYCYQKIVNKEKSINVHQQGEWKKFTSIPPICGSETELQERYKEIRAFCYQQGPPLIMLTVTSNEFDQKTFKIMRGLNNFNLEDEVLRVEAEKLHIRQEDINDQANLYVEFYLYLVDHLTRAIKNIFQYQYNPKNSWDSYSYGLFGKLKGLVKRIEFQDRGSIHFHILIFLQSNDEGLYDEKLLLYLKGLLSCFRMDSQKDYDFIAKHNLLHKCNASRCTKVDDQKCKEGFPFKPTKGYVNANYPIEIKQRRLTNEDSNVISYWQHLVKYFNSNIQLIVTADERIISYLMKYLNKKQTKQDLNQPEENREELNQEAQQIMDIIKQFYKDKVTHIQEACLAFQSEKIVEATYKTIKIQQIPFTRQQRQHSENIQDQLTADQTFQQLNQRNQYNQWWKYMRRPKEFELLNLMEYTLNTINYGNKSKYLDKFNKERSNRNIHVQDFKYFLDLDGCIIKLKEQQEQKQTVIVKTLLHSSVEYRNEDNTYYLEMLQFYFPHRYQEWINLTRDEWTGFKEAYEQQLDTYEYPTTTENPLAIYYKTKYCKFDEKPFRKYVEEYNNIKIHQKRMLEVMYRYKFNLQYSESKENNMSNLEFIYQQKQLIKQQLDLEFGYWRINQIKNILEVFNPQQDRADQELLDQANTLLQDLILDVKNDWNSLSQNAKNIIIGMGSLYNCFECAELQDEIKKHTEKNVVTKQKGKSQLQSQQLLFIRQSQGQILEEQPQERRHQTQISEELQLQEILSERLDDFHLKFENLYKNKLTIDEFNRNNVQREIKTWDIQRIDESLEKCYGNLNLQQRLAFLMIVTNITFTFKENRNDRTYEGTFIHGPGGVGKSHIIANVIKFATCFELRYKVLCPTQFAVQNISKMCQSLGVIADAQTLHSFFKFTLDQGIKSHTQNLMNYLGKQGVYNFTQTTEIFQKFMRFQFLNFQTLSATFRQLDVILIEEVSMVDPDFLSLLDIYAQISRQCAYPFGGIQVFLFGDSFQLQPVVQRRSNYFDSHIFKSGYFTHIIELTQSVRQAEDLEYFEKILQPVRFGEFHEDANNFYQQIQRLEQRIIPTNFFAPNQIVKKQLDDIHSQNQQIISLFFKNENVEQENQYRAIEMIKRIEENRKKRRNDDKKRFRQYLRQPIQFSWSNQKSEDDKMALLLGQRFQFKKEIYQANFDHQTHFLMLPIGIRNYLAKQLGEIAYRVAMKQKDLNKTLCLKELTLFEKAEIVLRKNLDKQENLINGQFAIISGLDFDCDFMNPYSMREAESGHHDYIKSRNYFYMIEEIKRDNIIRFTEQDKKEMNQYLQEKSALNINYLSEKDVTQAEKGLIYLKNVEPRLHRIRIKIGDMQTETLEIGEKEFSHQINVHKSEFARTLQEVLDTLFATREHVTKTLQTFPRWAQAAPRIKSWLIESGELELFGVDYINEQLSVDYLERCIIHLKFMMEKLPTVCRVQISQIPINLGYARTIHCAQGSTFDNVIIDLDMPERQQSGLLYTALSRVKRISNLFLSGKLDQNVFKVRVQDEIKKFYKERIMEVPKYLQNAELKGLVERDLMEIMYIVNQISSDIRQALIQLKQEQMNIQNH